MADPLLGQLGYNPKRAKELFLLGNSAVSAAAGDWVPFVVPKHASMLYLMVGGSGGGGGGGFSAATSTVKSGGGGGGSAGSRSRALAGREPLGGRLASCA